MTIKRGAETFGGCSVAPMLSVRGGAQATVPDPDGMFARAIDAGAREIAPVNNAHGWRLGRVVDPFGHHWEIGPPLG